MLTGLSAILLLAYPFAVYFGLNRFGFSVMAGVIGTLFLIRISTGWKAKLKELKYLAIVSGSAGLLLTLCGWLFKQYGWLTFYPVIVNVCLLLVFAFSLYQPQTIIERLARLQEPDLAQDGVIYTRKVTRVWCLFFIINGAISFYTCFQALAVWTLYNGFISYIAIGTLFAVEWIVRQFARKS